MPVIWSVVKGIFQCKFNPWFNTPWHQLRPPLERSSLLTATLPHHSPLSCSSFLLWGSPDESITECSSVPQLKDENVLLLLRGNEIKVITENVQGRERNWAFLYGLSNRIAALPHNRKLLQESGEMCSLYNRNSASCCLMPRTMCWDPISNVAEVWCYS